MSTKEPLQEWIWRSRGKVAVKYHVEAKLEADKYIAAAHLVLQVVAITWRVHEAESVVIQIDQHGRPLCPVHQGAGDRGLAHPRRPANDYQLGHALTPVLAIHGL